MLVVGLTTIVERVPHREGDPEKSLPANAPVRVQPLHPGLVAGPHVLGVPLELAAPLDQFFPKLEGLHEPLPTGDYLQGPFPTLVELHRVADGGRRADQVARLRQELGDPLAGSSGGEPGQLRLRCDRGLNVFRLPPRLTPSLEEMS